MAGGGPHLRIEVEVTIKGHLLPPTIIQIPIMVDRCSLMAGTEIMVINIRVTIIQIDPPCITIIVSHLLVTIIRVTHVMIIPTWKEMRTIMLGPGFITTRPIPVNLNIEIFLGKHKATNEAPN